MPSTQNTQSPSPPRAPAIQYDAPHGTRWDKEKTAAGGAKAFDLPSDPKVLGPWIVGECIGKGASGRVKIAKHRYTDQLAAVKILPRAPLDSSRHSITTQQAKSKKHSLGIEREITMMKLMNHPNILRIYDVYEGQKELFLVLEYVEGGELFDYLVNRGRLSEPDAICFFKQIIYGLNYAHTFSIIHRDLKPENILISSLSPPRVKIVDWGMAAFAPPSLQLETSCGSPHYASPEIVNGYKYTGNATDIWSCGVILYALLTGRLPFDDKDVKVLLGKVKVGKYDMPSFIDRSAQDLLSKMLVIDVNERITIPEILAHPWLNTSPAALRERSRSAASTSIEGGSLDPVLPPSPSTLARPISDPTSVDRDILFSLKIIWGRHADPAAILKDLGSPAGNGVHTKAFYWLLLRHHEEAEKLASEDVPEESEGDGSGASDGNSRVMGQSVTFNLGWELDTSGMGVGVGGAPVAKNPRGSSERTSVGMDHTRLGPHSVDPRRAGASDVLTSRRQQQTTNSLLPPLMTRNGSHTSGSTSTSAYPSRGRPVSPSGPRPPNVPGLPAPATGRSSYERRSSYGSSSTRSASSRSSSQPAKSSFALGNGSGFAAGDGSTAVRAGSVIHGGHGGPRPQPPRRGHTFHASRLEKTTTSGGASTSYKPGSDSGSGAGKAVSSVQFPPVQYTQSHRPVSRSSRPRSATTTADVEMEDDQRRAHGRGHGHGHGIGNERSQRPHSQSSHMRRGSGHGASSKTVASSVHSGTGTDSSSGSSTACSITSTATVIAPVPVRAVSGSGGCALDASVPGSGSGSGPMAADGCSSPTTPPVLPPLPALLPLAEPKANELAMQSELDELTEHVNELMVHLPKTKPIAASGAGAGAAAGNGTGVGRGRDLQTQLKDYHSQQRQQTARQCPPSSYQQQRFQSPTSSRRRAVSTAAVERGGKDKENKGNAGTGTGAGVADESWSYVAVEDGLNVVGAGRNGVLANSSNHAASADGGSGKGKKDKDGKKPRPPPLEFPPLNRKRSTISALGSPITLSPPVNNAQTKGGLQSPVVGEFKGWLSSLFSWKSAPNSGTGILYSTDDIAKTRRDLLHHLASLGVIVEANPSERGNERDGAPLKCRVDDNTSDALAHLQMKPLRFRIEFSPVSGEAGYGLPSSPVSPLSGSGHHFPIPTPGARGRSSTVGSGLKSPFMPSSPLPCPSLVSANGLRFVSAMIVIQEKGSAATYKAIWKKLRDVYEDGFGGYGSESSFSPVMTSTPLIEQPQRYAV